MAVISPSVPVMSLFGIQRSSSLLLLWLRRSAPYSASVLVTVGSVRAELLLQRLDFVTGTAELLAAGPRERAPPARALGTLAGQALDLESLGEAIVFSKPAVHATRLGISAEQLLALC